jgi:cytidylate kinase
LDWVYEETTVGLTTWLRNGKGLYWVSGKPGSGKSTFMKFIYGDQRTSELLHNWNSSSRQISASFFFHHRGSSVQRSFEGLLRSVLSQVMEEQPALRVLLGDVLDNVYRERIKIGRLGNLEADLVDLLKSCGVQDIIAISEKERRDLTRVPDAKEELRRVLSSVLGHRPALCGEIERELLTGTDKLLQRQVKDLEKVIDVFQKARLRDLPANVNLADIVRKWREKMGMELRVRRFLAARHIQPDVHMNRDIVVLAERHFARENIQQEIQRSEWTRRELEEALRGLLCQTIFDLDLCLFFDALDEYDGRPDAISAFLKDVVKEIPSSRTRIRVLFSSRPWPAFREAFGSSPGFEIHKHTENDIRDYCIASICNSPEPDELLLPMLPDIVRRAQGVFLWVKLVLQDLASVAAKMPDNVSDLGSELRKTLDSIPDQLDEYYSAIIERIPDVSRWGTYVVLEAVSRSEHNLSLADLLGTLQCANCATFDEGKDKLLLLPYEPPGLVDKLRALSGGLIDIVYPSSGKPYAQFMHQTCKEWVEDLRFKHIVLGQRSNATWENGHSFLAKYYFLNGKIPDPFIHHARLAEETTGISQYSFFSQAPSAYVRSQRLLHPDIRSLLGLAICYGLRLCLNNVIKEREFINHVSEPLFSLLDRALEKGYYSVAEATNVGKTLAENGFDITQDKRGLEGLITRMWTGAPPAEEIVALTKTALECCRDLEFGIEWNRVQDYKVLHLCTPELAQWLLERGAHPNSVNPLGETPLDFVLRTDQSPLAMVGLGYQHEYCRVLFRHGGNLLATPQEQWQTALRRFSSNGFDVADFPGSEALADDTPEERSQTGSGTQEGSSRTHSRARSEAKDSPSKRSSHTRSRTQGNSSKTRNRTTDGVKDESPKPQSPARRSHVGRQRAVFSWFRS